MAENSKEYYWNNDRIMRLIIGVVLTVGLVWLIYYLRDALLPFFVACAAAYLLQPLVELNRKLLHLKGRIIATVLTVVEVTAVVAGIAFISLPSVIKELDELGMILDGVASGKIRLPQGYVRFFNEIGRYFDPAYLSEWLSKMRFEDILSRSSSLLAESADVVLHVLSWALTLIYVLFILIDYPQISRGFKLIVPEKYREKYMEVVYDIKKGMNHYFRGQGLVALCAMAFYCIGFRIAGLPLAVPMGLLVGVLYMIPYFQYVTVIPVAAICFIYSLSGETAFFPELGKCLLVYVCSQCICDYLITPHVMGKELGLNPAIILLSLSVWGSLLGIIGMIIALPVTALILAYYERYISSRK